MHVQTAYPFCHIAYYSTRDVSLLFYHGFLRDKWIGYTFAKELLIVTYDGYGKMVIELGSGFFIEPENVVAIRNDVGLYEMETEKRKNAEEENGY